MSDSRLLISRAEAAERLSVSLRTFESKLQYQLKTVRIGRRVLVPVSELERLIEERAR